MHRAFLTSLGVYVPLFYLQLFAVDHNVNSCITTYSLVILNTGSTLGRLVPTFLADKLGVYNMLVPAMAACAGLIFAIFGATNGPGVILVGLIFSFVLGAYISLISSLRVQLCRNMGELSVKMGLAYTAVAAANLIGNLIAGALLGTSTGGPLTWWRAIVFTGVSSSPLISLPRFIIHCHTRADFVAWVAALRGGRGGMYGVVEITVHQRFPFCARSAVVEASWKTIVEAVRHPAVGAIPVKIVRDGKEITEYFITPKVDKALKELKLEIVKHALMYQSKLTCPNEDIPQGYSEEQLLLYAASWGMDTWPVASGQQMNDYMAKEEAEHSMADGKCSTDMNIL
ncbi:hypothetical protein EVJ58_g10726 [Rhodofomes roseus]|uniref:MFS transporter n=1 Tax=Rhodofomes roseus TaxID=34475 RepID=A0A4Y9XM23_9APHY|nr:hypothetical protein EVJ58_g10726 [Rhodofomes roseus]